MIAMMVPSSRENKNHQNKNPALRAYHHNNLSIKIVRQIVRTICLERRVQLAKLVAADWIYQAGNVWRLAF